ncbi:thermonuclease family protein [Ferirhizobium litorale]|uniref:Thermonuclease family protein n=1 Tax=Ferirhizobium litorale TaxID=2927786 RepID=A0AAE3QK79_9HYPH|nr:thermonuclease family protein [Fererhizobium litorale]MDI7925010.1 thermonuclease family protein [Fererhizobium litorale]
MLALIGLLALKLDDGGQSLHAGRFEAVDGDTLRLGPDRLRLKGLDAPEYLQTCHAASGDWPCGRHALQLLATLIAGGQAECTGSGRDRYDRILVICRAGGLEVNSELVRRGMAVAYGAYNDEEVAARREGKGLWAGTFDVPEDWRRQHIGIDADGSPADSPVDYLLKLFGLT